jgi:hypothetical protein
LERLHGRFPFCGWTTGAKTSETAVWVNWAGSQADQRVFHFGDGGTKYAYLTPKDSATGNLKFVISVKGKAGEQTLVAPVSLPAKTWTHVAVTLKGSVGTLYVDGKEAAANNALTLDPEMVLGPNTLAGNDCMFLGRSDKGDYFEGLLTDFRVYVQPQEAPAIAALSEQIKNQSAAVVAATKDTTPPQCAAPGFLLPPTVAGDTAIVMSAPRGSDDGMCVEYRFTCTSGRGHDSGWISSNHWTDCLLEPGKTYAYTYKLRDREGNETPASAPGEVALPKDAAAPEGVDFAEGPAGISNTAIRMTAKRAKDASALVEYRFTRDDGTASGWQASPTWTDRGLAEGSKHSYTVQARDGWGNVSAASAATLAVARDDTPPTRYRVGEWATLPYATVEKDRKSVV